MTIRNFIHFLPLVTLSVVVLGMSPPLYAAEELTE